MAGIHSLMNKGLTIGAGVGIVVVIATIAGIMLSNQPSQTSDLQIETVQSQPVQPATNENKVNESTQAETVQPKATQPVAEQTLNESTQTVSIKSPQDVLPTRQDLETIWRIGGTTVPDDLEIQGYNEGIEQEFYKGQGNPVVRVTVYEFKTTNDATNYYDGIVNAEYARGGYEEINLSGIRAECYGMFKEGLVNNVIHVYCVKENFYYHSYIVGKVMMDERDEIELIPSIIANKI